MVTKHEDIKKPVSKPESVKPVQPWPDQRTVQEQDRNQDQPVRKTGGDANAMMDNKTGGGSDAMMNNLIKEPAGPQVKLSPAPGDSQINPNLVAQVGEAGWTDPPQGKTVLAEKDGAPMLVQFKINANTGPNGGFYSQMTPKGGFSCFEGKVDAWTEIPKTHKHRKVPPAAAA